MRFARHNQQGMASIVIVSVLVVILTLVSVAFGRLMDRAVTNSTNKELSAAANYAADSGINDAANYIKSNYTKGVSAITMLKCNSLQQAGLNYQLSATGPVQYSCLTINPEAPDLVFGGQDPLPPYKSQVVKMTTDASTGGATDKLLISWASGDGHNGTVGGTSLYPETGGSSWASQSLSPMLRVTLYPIAADGTIVNSQRTYFFYPGGGSGGNNVTAVGAPGEPLQRVQCGNAALNGGSAFNLGNDTLAGYTCSVIVTGLSGAIGSGGYYYARLTPLYDSANVRIIANDSSGDVLKFQGVQGVIDSTAQASSSVKRLQARVDLSSLSGSGSDNIPPAANTIPEYAHASANTLCKQLDVTSVTVLAPNCTNLSITQPVLALAACTAAGGSSCSPSATGLPQATISYDTTATVDWTVTNSIPGSCSLSNGGPSGFGDGSGSYTSGNLTSATTYTLSCQDYTGTTKSLSTKVNVNPPAPVVSLTANPTSTTVGNSSTLTWSATNSPTSCTASGGSWSGNQAASGSTSTGALNSVQTYTYTLTCSNAGGSGSATATVTVSAAPSPPPSGGSTCTDPTATNYGSPIPCTYSGSPPPTCPSGTTGTPPNCVTPPGGTCPSGTTGTPPNCVTPPSGGTPPPSGGSGPGPIVVQGSVVGAYIFSGSYAGATCHDGLHPYILCFSWNAYQTDGGAGGIINGPCQVTGNTTNYGSLGAPYYSTSEQADTPTVWNFWNRTLGWDANPGNINVYISCTSATYPSTPAGTFSFTWSGASFCPSTTGTDCTSNTVPAPAPPPPPPPPPITCPPGDILVGTTCTPSCAINLPGVPGIKLFMPDFGLMGLGFAPLFGVAIC